MNRRLRWRVVATLVVTFGISIFAWYPLLAERVGLPNPGFMQEKRLRLGLDLEGGVHLVMRVNTDDAVLVETRHTAARLDEGLGRHGVRERLRSTCSGQASFGSPGLRPMGLRLFDGCPMRWRPVSIGRLARAASTRSR